MILGIVLHRNRRLKASIAFHCRSSVQNSDPPNVVPAELEYRHTGRVEVIVKK
jgi:hypothetical protein